MSRLVQVTEITESPLTIVFKEEINYFTEMKMKVIAQVDHSASNTALKERKMVLGLCIKK